MNGAHGADVTGDLERYELVFIGVGLGKSIL